MLTSRLAEFIYNTRFEDIPAPVVKQAKMHIFDTIGAILAGSGQSMGKLVARHAASLGGSPEASVFGHGYKTSPPQAAFANGTMGNILDIDDDSDTCFSHPSTTLIPTLFALGESQNTGAEILTAYIVGEEVTARIARVPELFPGHYERGWHPTATLGVMGATAAAAKILNLDPISIRHALGMAASEASGLRANFASMAKALHAGNTAAKAVNAALLAKAGITANTFVLESPAGFLDLFGGDRTCDFTEITQTLGSEWDFASPGINIKRYPSCYYTHSAVDLLLELMDKKAFDHQDIESIYCAISPIAGEVLSDSVPENGLSAKYHLPYCLAVAAYFGGLDISHFVDNRYLKQPEILRLMEYIQTIVVPEIGEDGLGLGARLAVTTQKHGTLAKTKSKPRGGGQEPLTWEELHQKFNACINGFLDTRPAAYIERSIRKMEELETISDLVTVASHLGMDKAS